MSVLMTYIEYLHRAFSRPAKPLREAVPLYSATGGCDTPPGNLVDTTQLLLYLNHRCTPQRVRRVGGFHSGVTQHEERITCTKAHHCKSLPLGLGTGRTGRQGWPGKQLGVMKGELLQALECTAIGTSDSSV